MELIFDIKCAITSIEKNQIHRSTVTEKYRIITILVNLLSISIHSFKKLIEIDKKIEQKFIFPE